MVVCGDVSLGCSQDVICKVCHVVVCEFLSFSGLRKNVVGVLCERVISYLSDLLEVYSLSRLGVAYDESCEDSGWELEEAHPSVFRIVFGLVF